MDVRKECLKLVIGLSGSAVNQTSIWLESGRTTRTPERPRWSRSNRCYCFCSVGVLWTRTVNPLCVVPLERMWCQYWLQSISITLCASGHSVRLRSTTWSLGFG